MLILLAMGCFKGASEDSSPVDTTPTEITYPDSQAVLLYSGHGGDSGDTYGNGDWSEVSAQVTEQNGFTFDQRDSMGDMSAYRAVLMLSPGQVEDVVVGTNGVQTIEDAMAAGTRVVLMAGAENCAGRAVTSLLEDLGAPMRFTGEDLGSPAVAEPGSGLQTSKGIEQGVLLSNPCLLETNGADALLYDGRDVFAAAWRPGWGGDLVVVGDYRFGDNTKWENRDNLRFVLNLVEVDPDY